MQCPSEELTNYCCLTFIAYQAIWRSLKCAGKWPSMPHACLPLLIWYYFKMPTLSQKNPGHQEIQLAFIAISYRLRKQTLFIVLITQTTKHALFVKNDETLNLKLGGIYSNQMDS